MTRRDVLKACTAGLPSSTVLRSGSGAQDMLQAFDYSGVRLREGMFRRQCLAARDFFYSIPDDNFLIGFRTRAGLSAPGAPLAGWYNGDVFNAFGQYLSGMTRLSRALHDDAMLAKARRLMAEWAKTIESNGYFFYSRKPITPHYSFDKMMCGLVDLYHYGGVAEAARLIEKITAWAVVNLDRARKRPLQDGATYDGNGEWYTLAENLYRAYQYTGVEACRTFGDVWRYRSYWDMFTRREPPDPFGYHAYSHVNTLSSAAMTYAVSGDPHYLNVITNAFDWLERTQMYATGGYGPDEKMVRPDGGLGASLESTHNSFETVCGTWAGFKLGRYLMRFTGEAKYGDWIERLLYNGIGAALAMKPDGSNFYYSEYTFGGGRKAYAFTKWSCCSGSYPQAIADYHNIVYLHNRDGLYVNLYVPSDVTWHRGENEIKVEQDTQYPDTDMTMLTVSPARAEEFAMNFRVPRWCSPGLTVTVNGQAAKIDAKPGSWAAIRRKWDAGDRVIVRIPMQLSYAPIDARHPNRVAVTYGPLVLVRCDSTTLFPGKGELSRWMARRGEGLEFDARNQPQGSFVPFYRVGFAQGYHMYFDLDRAI
jgi:hypothetical protein